MQKIKLVLSNDMGLDLEAVAKALNKENPKVLHMPVFIGTNMDTPIKIVEV